MVSKPLITHLKKRDLIICKIYYIYLFFIKDRIKINLKIRFWVLNEVEDYAIAVKVYMFILIYY